MRKQEFKDAGDITSGSQQEDEACDDSRELSSSLLSPVLSREKHRQGRENKSKLKEMTEEEMMDLALRLSEQEANISERRQQKEEEEAMMKAIQESMITQTQLCPPSQSQSLLGEAGASLRNLPRRRLAYSIGKTVSAQPSSETDLNQEAKRSTDESMRSKKRKREEGSPLLEMPNLSQTQKINSQASPCSSEVLDLCLDSPQSSDSTQVDECQLRKSPVFPLTYCKAEVHVPRLSQDQLQNCKTLGFVWCSQDSSPLKSLPAPSKSPTFPRSAECCSDLAVHRSPVFSENNQGDAGNVSPEICKSPVFGRTSQHENCSSPCKPRVCSPGLMLSSQESLTSSMRTTSCRAQSPVFPSSLGPLKSHHPPETSSLSKSPASSGSDEGQTGLDHRTSPAFDKSGQQTGPAVQKDSKRCSAAGLRSVRRETVSASESRNLGEDAEPADHRTVRLKESSNADLTEEALKEKPEDSDNAELTSNMVLLWSDDDDDVTQVGSPSPVFPEERPVHQTVVEPASPNHVPPTPVEPTPSICRSTSSSMSTGRRQHCSTAHQPISRQEMVGGNREPAGSTTVHYYWGVPFCPQGLDPDRYTQVILAQMEVYEKSLKEAQRCLLRKAEWGEAILPQPEKSPSPHQSPADSPQEEDFLQRRNVRMKSKKLSDAAETPPGEADEKGEEEENKVEAEDEQTESKEEEKRSREGGEQMDIDDCEICPETPLNDSDDDRTQDLIMVTDSAAALPSRKAELPEVEMILQDDSPTADEYKEEEIQEDAPEDRKTEGNIHERSSQVGGQNMRSELEEMEVENRVEPDVEKVKARGLQKSTSPELEPAISPQVTETSVECPICQGSFPVTEIEMHAAYCDGEEAIAARRRPRGDSCQGSLKSRRKRVRRAEEEDSSDACSSDRFKEKCYICQAAVPLRDYSRHTELCIQRLDAKSAAKENLLSALDKTESGDSDAIPSGSRLQPRDVIDLRNDDEEEEGAIRISNSPIRAFTPISEATDCLIDFRKQSRSKKLSQRRR